MYLAEVGKIAAAFPHAEVEAIATELRLLRERGGRLFCFGIGGGAANASHAVNDFRKLCGIQAFTPTDNVAELTARVNDEGWENSFSDWLKEFGPTKNDAVLVFSVGGGDTVHQISMNLVRALQLAKKSDTKILGIVGRDGGYTKTVADAVALVPTIEPSRITPHTEAFQAVVLHCLVSHPLLQVNRTKW